jgi:hypothetical protein
MADKTDLLGSILDYWQGLQQQTQAKPAGPTGVYSQTKQGLQTMGGDVKGMSPDEIEKISKSYGDIGKFAKDINKSIKSLNMIQLKTKDLMHRYSMSWKDALKYTEKELRTSKSLSKEEKARHADMLSYLLKQQKIESEISKLQLKRQAAERVFGKGTLASTMIGGGMPKGPGGESKPGLVAAGVMIGAASAISDALIEGMKKSFSGGAKGVLDAVGGTFTKGISALSPAIGAKVGGLIELVIDVIMYDWENQIALARGGLHALARTGQEDMMASMGAQMFGMPREMALSWKKALWDTGTAGTEKMMRQFTLLGLSMDYGAEETGKMTEQLISAVGDPQKALDKLTKTFGFAQIAVKKTGIDTDKWVKTLTKLAPEARASNIGFQSVLGTMNILKDSTKYLGAFGVDLRTQMGEVSSAMVNVGKNWDLAMHAFVGTSQFGGKDVMESAYKSMFGSSAMRAMQVTTAGTIRMPTKPGGGQFQYTDEGLLPGRLEAMRAKALEAGKGVSNPYQRVEIERRMLEMMGVKDVGAQMQMLKEGVNFKDLAKTPEFKYAFKSKSPEAILGKILSVSDRTEVIQGAIKDILIGILGTVITIGKKMSSPMTDYSKVFEGYEKKMLGGFGGAKGAVKPGVESFLNEFEKINKGAVPGGAAKSTLKSVGSLMPGISSSMVIYDLAKKLVPSGGSGSSGGDVNVNLVIDDKVGVQTYLKNEQKKASNTQGY